LNYVRLRVLRALREKVILRVGTIAYAAPEAQQSKGNKYDYKVDIYSLGVHSSTIL
jgi:serine/threonine protein kinase